MSNFFKMASEFFDTDGNKWIKIDRDGINSFTAILVDEDVKVNGRTIHINDHTKLHMNRFHFNGAFKENLIGYIKNPLKSPIQSLIKDIRNNAKVDVETFDENLYGWCCYNTRCISGVGFVKVSNKLTKRELQRMVVAGETVYYANPNDYKFSYLDDERNRPRLIDDSYKNGLLVKWKDDSLTHHKKDGTLEVVIKDAVEDLGEYSAKSVYDDLYNPIREDFNKLVINYGE